MKNFPGEEIRISTRDNFIISMQRTGISTGENRNFHWREPEFSLERTRISMQRTGISTGENMNFLDENRNFH